MSSSTARAHSIRRKLIRFSVDREHLRRLEIEPGVMIYHAYPTLSSWVGRETPDDVNPRSHEDRTLTGNVPKAIEQTLRDNPGDFYLANRGGTVLAESFAFDPDKQSAEIILTDFEGADARRGMADGGTTDAVIARVQREILEALEMDNFQDLTPDQMPPFLHQSRIHLEIIVGLEDRDRIRQLVQGRNTSKQVRSWTIADFKGDFNWIKDVLEAPDSDFKGRIGYEENSGAPVNVLEILAILTLFHQAYDAKSKAPTVAYSSKGRMDTRLADENLAPGYRALASIVKDILHLHDYVYSKFHTVYKEARPGGKLGRRGSRDDRIFPRTPKDLPLSGRRSEYVVPSGVLYPLLASLRALVQYNQNGRAEWRMDPIKFFDKFGAELMDNLLEQLGVVGDNPQTLGKTKTVYTALHNQAKLLVAEVENEISA
jgi:hypothetical protein